MKEEVHVTKTPYYECPRECKEVCFYQDGILEATELLDENGKHIEYKTFDFIPNSDSVLKCRICGEIAIQKTKKVTVTTVIE